MGVHRDLLPRSNVLFVNGPILHLVLTARKPGHLSLHIRGLFEDFLDLFVWGIRCPAGAADIVSRWLRVVWCGRQ